MLTSTLAVIASVYQVAALPAAYRAGQTVQTTSGPVQGHSSSGHTEVSEYLGIPYVCQIVPHNISTRTDRCNAGATSSRRFTLGTTAAFHGRCYN
jgi:hypothetical protein